MKKRISLSILSTIFLFFSASTQQVLVKAGIQVSAPCKLENDSYFKEQAEAQGAKVIGAYICTDHEDDYYHASIVNIVVYDMAANYSNINPDQYVLFENQMVDSYIKSLSSSGISFKKINYLGINAVEYTFEQMDLPTKAIIFWKNKKSYLVQLGSRDNYLDKFNSLKNSFSIL